MFIILNGRRLVPRLLGLLAALALALMIGQIHPSARPTAGTPQAISRADIQAKRLALTFDVTWGEKNLPAIVQALHDHQARATFFVTAAWAETHADMLKQLHAAGYEIGTMGTIQNDLTALPEMRVHASLVAAQAGLNQILGQPARYFRPPLGRHSETVLKAAGAANLVTVIAAVVSPDIVQPDTPASKVAQRVLDAARPGDIVELTASDFSPSTPRALGQILAAWKEQGVAVESVGSLIPLAAEPATPTPAQRAPTMPVLPTPAPKTP